mmetsp:Transcript_7219/g.13715  ORF Transcript_7219/g.13715 Transcript_7219/m.13715 type:complete len:241 (+) Transcript_7219:155-877(+)
MIGKRFLALSLLSISYVNATNFTIALKECSGDIDVVTLDSVALDCEGSEYCTWGSVAQVSGAFTIVEDLESSVAEVKAKAFGNKYFDDEIDICNYVQGPTIPEGLTCPAAGTYGYSTEITLPVDPKEKWYNKFLYKTYGKKEVKFDFEEIDAKVKCKIYMYMEGSTEKEKKGKKKSKKSSYDDDDEDYVTAGAALVIVGAAAAFGINKRRRIVTGSGALLGEDQIGSNFEMMGNKNNAVV